MQNLNNAVTQATAQQIVNILQDAMQALVEAEIDNDCTTACCDVLLQQIATLNAQHNNTLVTTTVSGCPFIYVTDEGTTLHYNYFDELHNENGPAVIYANGEQFWYINYKELKEEQFLQWQTNNKV